MKKEELIKHAEKIYELDREEKFLELDDYIINIIDSDPDNVFSNMDFIDDYIQNKIL